jgi:uncharacterized protein YndB with AHSA1/START domain
MIKIIAIAVIFLIAGLLVFVATRPDEFEVQRTASIKAAPEKIFPYINDLHRWGLWSPYEKKDPAMKRTYSGSAGKGAAYEWEGNGKVGKGRVEIRSTVPPFEVLIKLDMIKPIEGHNSVRFSLEPEGEATHVTWAMRGDRSYGAKVVGLFVNMDRMIGKDFETGLANLKAVVEK